MVVHGDNAAVLAKLPDESFQLVYIDPPFNTGGRRDRRTLRVAREQGDEAAGTAPASAGAATPAWRPAGCPTRDSFADYAGFLARGWRRPAGC